MSNASVTKCEYTMRRGTGPTQFDYDIVTFEVSQLLDAEAPISAESMAAMCRGSCVKALGAAKAVHVQVQQPQPAYAGQGQGRSGGPKGPPRASAGLYVYKLPYPTDEGWKQTCKQSGGGWDGIAKLWKSNVLLQGAEQYLVSGPSQQQALPGDQTGFEEDVPEFLR